MDAADAAASVSSAHATFTGDVPSARARGGSARAGETPPLGAVQATLKRPGIPGPFWTAKGKTLTRPDLAA